MKHRGLLHPELSSIVAEIGHTQTIVIGDVGLPIPAGVRRIDLAVSAGVPSLLDVLEAVLSELIIEGVTVAEETRLFSPEWSARLETALPMPRREVPHTVFKELVQDAYVVVRTGEVTSYANVLLHCGVNFWEDPYRDRNGEAGGLK